MPPFPRARPIEVKSAPDIGRGHYLPENRILGKHLQPENYQCYLELAMNKIGRWYRNVMYLVKQKPHLAPRRSFRAVGESCVINLIPDQKPGNVPQTSNNPVHMMPPYGCICREWGYQVPVKAPNRAASGLSREWGKVCNYA